MASDTRLLRTLIVASAGYPVDAMRASLADAGCDIVDASALDAALAARIGQLRPDLIVLGAAAGAGRLAAKVVLACGSERRPVVVLTADDSAASIDEATAAGVAAYVLGGLEPGRIKGVLGVALARFRQHEKLLGELSGAHTRLAERKVIDRAKGILMRRHQMGEDEAYRKMRSMAMNKKLKLSDLAQRLLDVDELLDK